MLHTSASVDGMGFNDMHIPMQMNIAVLLHVEYFAFIFTTAACREIKLFSSLKDTKENL